MKMQRNPLLFAYTTLVFVFLLGPLLIVMATSLSNTSYLTFPPRGITLHWFENALENSDFRTAFSTSLQVATLGTLIALLVGVPAAYATIRFRVKVPRLVANLFVLPILIPEIVFGFSILKMFSAVQGMPIFPVLLIGHSILVTPYVVRVVASNLQAFDFSAEEAAISLGSPRLKTFFTIILPNIRSGILASFILAFITSINDVSTSLFLTGPGVSTLPIYMLSYVETFFDPTISALSVMLMVLTTVVMIAVEKTLGLTKVMR